MKKYLVTIEFRYAKLPKSERDSCHASQNITIGVYDSFDEAILNGNDLLINLENKFDLHVFPNGRGVAKRKRFSENGGPFGSKNILVTNLAYLRTPFDFCAKITTLDYLAIDNVIDSVVKSTEGVKNLQSIYKPLNK